MRLKNPLWYFVILIGILLLIALIPASPWKVKRIEKRVLCGVNLKAIFTAMAVYMNDYENRYPTPEQWCDLLIQEGQLPVGNFQCPASKQTAYAYAMNENLIDIDQQTVDASFAEKLVVLFESDLGKNSVGGPDDVVLRHNNGCNVLFADGHTEFVKEDYLDDLMWTAK